MSQESKVLPENDEEIPTTPCPPSREVAQQPERTRLIVFGVAKIQKTRLLATLSGLKVKSVLKCKFCNPKIYFHQF